MKKLVRLISFATLILAIGILPVAANSSSPFQYQTDANNSVYIPAVTTNGQSFSVAASPNSNSASIDNGLILVQLKGDPLSISAKTKPPQGKKIDFNSTAVKSYRAQLAAERNDFKAWLRANAPKAKVTGEFDISLNAVAVQLNTETLAKISSAPMVQFAQYENLYQPTVDDPDLAIISAVQAWDQAGGAANAGEGVKVAILDTGIDITHPCFSDVGYPATKQLGDTKFTNNKVIVAKVFNMKTPSRGYTPEAIQDHGTHVAGTVACNFDTPASVDGVAIPHGISGVAPRAILGNYNIFPGDVLNARSEDIVNALEAAYADGFDVANMSLGGNAHGIQDLLSIAVNNLDQADMVVAVAAGNSGPGHYTVESPGSAARALAAGASTVNHFVGAPITVGNVVYQAAAGDFGVATSDITAPLAVVTDTAGMSLGCSTLGVDLTGKIGVLARGVCSFSIKIRNLQAAHATAAVIVNNVQGDPIAMGQDGTPNQPTIPAYMVGVGAKAGLAGSNGVSATISASLQYFVTNNADFMAGFSGEGPTDVDFRVKPDVVAPGVNVLSSIPHQFCGTPPCFAFFQGTSMATPHLAGSAAVIIGQHPGWSAAEVRSAIVNTAEADVLKTFNTGVVATDVNVIGAGRENLLNAVNATVALDPVSISFGAVPSGSGQTRDFSLTLTNLGASASFSLAISDTMGAGVGFSVSPASLSLGAGESGTVTVSMSTDKRITVGDNQAWLKVMKDGNVVAHAAVYAFVK